MSISPGTSEYDPSVYVTDFAELVRMMDDAVFGSLGKSITPLVCEEVDEEGYYLSAKLVSYGRYPERARYFPFLVRPAREEYRVWRWRVIALAEHFLRCPCGRGMGDGEFKRLLTAYALAVVRKRVLINSAWFTNVHLRTLPRVFRYEQIPLAWKERLIKERPKLSRESECTPCEADLEILLFLVDLEMEAGVELRDTLHLLTNSTRT